MNTFSVYRGDGRITRVGTSGQDINLQPGQGEFVISGVFEPALYFIKNGVAIKRQDFTLDALPLPCTIWIEGQEYRCHEQPEFVFDAPGTYEIRVDAGPQYLEKVFQYDYQP